MSQKYKEIKIEPLIYEANFGRHFDLSYLRNKVTICLYCKGKGRDEYGGYCTGYYCTFCEGLCKVKLI